MAVKKSSRSPKSKTAVAAPVALKAIAKKQTKSQILISIAEETTVPKKTVLAVLESLGNHVLRHMKKRGSGEFTIPESGIRIIRKTRPATKKRPGRNPLTGEAIMIPAKPARTVVKLRALKSLKESVES